MQNQIPSNWRDITLGDVIKITRGASPRPIQDYLSSKGMPWVKIADATASDSRFIERTKECIRMEGVKNSVTVDKGELIVSNSATPGIPKFMKIKACVHDGWLIFRDFKGIFPDYTYYYMLWARKNLVSKITGSIFDNLKTDIVKQFPIKLPPENIQFKMANILCSFDDKIEVNNKIAKTLEEMAQAIFKEWFVKFRFHGHEEADFTNSELGKIPKAWRVGTMGDIAKLTMGLSPKSEFYNIQNKGLPLLNGAADLSKDGFYPKRYTSEITRIGEKGSIIFCIRATIGNINIADKDYCLGRGVASLEPKQGRYYLYSLFILKNALKILSQGSGGSVILGLTKDDVDGLKILIPEDKVTLQFQNLINPIWGRLEKIKEENQKLAAMRDLLLPKLMKGEIRV